MKKLFLVLGVILFIVNKVAESIQPMITRIPFLGKALSAAISPGVKITGFLWKPFLILAAILFLIGFIVNFIKRKRNMREQQQIVSTAVQQAAKQVSQQGTFRAAPSDNINEINHF